jgi:solute carrier family 25 protein 33/36
MKPAYSLGGMCGAIVTSPFDVVKTRLQSDLFRQKHSAVNVIGGGGAGSAVFGAPRPANLLYNFVETGYIIRCVAPLAPLTVRLLTQTDR